MRPVPTTPGYGSRAAPWGHGCGRWYQVPEAPPERSKGPVDTPGPGGQYSGLDDDHLAHA